MGEKRIIYVYEKRGRRYRRSFLVRILVDRREPRNNVICPKKLRSQVWKFMVGHVVGNLKFNIQRGWRLHGGWELYDWVEKRGGGGGRGGERRNRGGTA